jgi:catechol 1,2-dioxygenase
VIITNAEHVTEAVLKDVANTPDPRMREILSTLVRHLHGFVREIRLTEAEFHQAVRYINAIGQTTSPSHNEAMLLAGAIGVSNLVCLMNNGTPRGQGTHANTLGPFWRADAPFTENGASIVRSPTPGPPLHFRGQVRDMDGRPLSGAEIDVWQSSPNGLYENQDETQADMNLRGRFVTDEDGCFSFKSVRPAGYPIPAEGPTGALLRVQGRHNFRPAHIHFLIFKPGFKTITSQVYDPEDPNIESDSQYGVTESLLGCYVKQADDSYSLEFAFTLEAGEARRPIPPIKAKAA